MLVNDEGKSKGNKLSLKRFVRKIMTGMPDKKNILAPTHKVIIDLEVILERHIK